MLKTVDDYLDIFSQAMDAAGTRKLPKGANSIPIFVLRQNRRDLRAGGR